MNGYDTALDDLSIIVPTRAQSALTVFIGKWAIAGENYSETSMQPSTEVRGIESYEWFTGGFFMLHKWDRHFDEITQIGMSIICFDENSGTYQINSYDNMGYQKSYQITNQDETWKFVGQQQRATIVFNTKSDRFTETWDTFVNGVWQPLCKLHAEKIS